MDIVEHIDIWTDLIKNNRYRYFKESSEEISEAKTPYSIGELMQSFERDVSDEKLVPTEDFLEATYNIFNERLFENKLPRNLIFTIKSQPRSNFIGAASYRINNLIHEITPIAIKLNSSRKLTLHDWMGVVLHEMVHVWDYVTFPEHFLGYARKYYNSHGRVFLEKGREFEQYGYKIEKYCNKDIGINTDDRRVSNRMNKTALIILNGYDTGGQGDAVIPVSFNQLEKTEEILSQMVSNRSNMKKLKSLTILKSDNPQIVRLKQARLKNSHSGFSYYFFDDDFKKKYGPFQEVDKVNILGLEPILEDKDEVEFDDMNHIDDEYAKKMYDNISNIVGIKKIDDEIYEVSIA